MSDLTPMQAAFCAAYAETGNAARAARIAGYSPNAARQLGSRLLGRPKIVQRIAELRAAIAERDALNAPTLLAKLEAIYQEALDANQFYAAARAVDLQARLRGLYPGSSHGDARSDHDLSEAFHGFDKSCESDQHQRCRADSHGLRIACRPAAPTSPGAANSDPNIP